MVYFFRPKNHTISESILLRFLRSSNAFIVYNDDILIPYSYILKCTHLYLKTDNTVKMQLLHAISITMILDFAKLSSLHRRSIIDV